MTPVLARQLDHYSLRDLNALSGAASDQQTMFHLNEDREGEAPTVRPPDLNRHFQGPAV